MSSKVRTVLAMSVILLSAQAFAASNAIEKDGIKITSSTTSYELIQQKNKQGHPLCVIIHDMKCIGEDQRNCNDGWSTADMEGQYGENDKCYAPRPDDDYDRYKVLPYLKSGVSFKGDDDDNACIARQKRAIEAAYNSDVRRLLNERGISSIEIRLVDNSESQLKSDKAAKIPYGIDIHSTPGKLLLQIQEIPTLDEDHCKDMSVKFLRDQFINLEIMENGARPAEAIRGEAENMNAEVGANAAEKTP